MKIKSNKGITLIALIITIIILLILAAVTIMSLTGDGIIEKSKQAKIEYEKGKKEEEGLLSGYLSKMDEISSEESNSSTGERPQIGDKVAYNEGSGKTSSIDSNFVMKDMEWRILDVEDDGRIELISTQPTDSQLTLSGEEGWLKGETKLDTLCNDLYANGTGVTSRSLKIEDINKLGNYDPNTYNGYGYMYIYKYDSTSTKIQYSASADNGNTWSEYYNTAFSRFKAPGEKEINSENYKDFNENSIEKELVQDAYFYTVSDYVKQSTTDGISMSRLITEGLNNANSAPSNSIIRQWLSSRTIQCDSNYVKYGLRATFDKGGIGYDVIWYSDVISASKTNAVRPVVVLPANSLTKKVDGIWQVNL